jgi:hypothetical protein
MKCNPLHMANLDDQQFEGKDFADENNMQTNNRFKYAEETEGDLGLRGDEWVDDTLNYDATFPDPQYGINVGTSISLRSW